jgi:molybdopterin-guanine dinucleotide biosynthesis protein A
VTGAGEPLRLGAVILSGGAAERMGGVDKASIEVQGVTLLERALAATMSAVEVVVVGAQVPTSRPVTWALEDPVGGGPAAGLLAATDRFLTAPDLLVVLAVDMPRVHAGTVARLVGALGSSADADGAQLVDPEGRQQPLAAVYRYPALVGAAPVDVEQRHGLAVRRLVGDLHLVEVPAVGDEARDVDTWEDLAELDR